MGGRRQAPGRVMTRKAPIRGNPNRKTYTAMYRCGDRELSAGTFETYAEAEDAWLRQATAVRRGTHIDPGRSRMLFRDFVEFYRSLRTGRAKTLLDQDSAIRTHLLPTFGTFQMREISTEAIQGWIAGLAGTHSPHTRRSLLGQLSGILTAAVTWGYLEKHPMPGVKPPKDALIHSRELDRAEFEKIHNALSGPTSKLFARTALNSGCRFGELSELRVDDIHSLDEDLPEDQLPDEELIYFHVWRSVADVGADYGDDGGRFKVEPTKNGEDRRVTLDAQTSSEILDHIERHGLEGNDLIFPLGLFLAELEIFGEVPLEPIPADVGRTTPNKNGRTYEHGTMSAYTAGACRCMWCRRAMAEYRTARRAAGLDQRQKRASKRGENTSGHLPRDTFRRRFWIPALKSAGLEKIRFHDLRHTHATWLARRGVDIIELQERMGHKRLSTTQIYITKNRKPTTTAALLIGRIMSEPVQDRRLRRLRSAG